MPKGIYKRVTKWKLSDKAKDNIRKGKIGSKHSKATKDKIGKANSHPRPEFLGEKHPRWTNGNINYWKNKAKIRDHFTCQICGLYDPEIVEIDHIKPKSKYPELYKELSNMMTICPNCHRRKTLREKEFSS